VKKAAQRILDQVGTYGSTRYPYTFETSLSTYDAGGNSQAYNTGLSVVAYHLVAYLAGIMGEPQTSSIYEDAFQKATRSFEDRWLDNPYDVGNYCESVLGGLWISNFLKMNSPWEKRKLDNLYATIFNWYNPLNTGMGQYGGSYSEWQPYLIGHLGGYSLQTNRDRVWLALQRDMYERNYYDRNLVFNQQLGIPPKVVSPKWIATSTAGSNQYISIPVLWRNYYELVGYHRNKYSGELWLEPALFDSLNHSLQNALIITPEGYATISYTGYGASYQNQEIVFKPDRPMDVSSVYVRDLYAVSQNAVRAVKVNGVDTEFLRVGSGDQAHLKLDWAGTIPVSGINIRIEGEPKLSDVIPSPPEILRGEALGPSQILLTWTATQTGITGYVVEARIRGLWQPIGTTSVNDTSYIDTGLLPSTAYTYRVRAYTVQNFSDPSVEIGVTTKGWEAGEVVVALNSGGNAYRSATGIQYIGDASTGWVSGGSTYATTDTIAGTQDDVLYQTERYGTFAYTIPLDNGSYDIVLKFAEIYQDTPNARIFHVDIEGVRVIKNLDLFLRIGKNRAYDVVVPVVLTDGVLNINFVTVADNAKISALEIRKHIPTRISDYELRTIPTNFFLSQNFPNPYNSVTRIQYALPDESYVRLTLYDVLGEQVAVLVDEREKAGYYGVRYDAGNLASGIYFYRIEAGGFQAVRKMILLK